LQTGFIPFKKWAQQIYHAIESIKPSVIVQDSFPFGLCGEDLSLYADDIPFVYLARCLNSENYLAAIQKPWDLSSPLIAETIITEPLKPEHQNLILRSVSKITTLPGRIRFPADRIALPPIGAELGAALKDAKTHLVVHSGPAHEVRQLTALAEKNVKDRKNEKIIIINPALAGKGHTDSFDYFPASALFPSAFKIYTGAGYNCTAESEIQPEKHHIIPFKRLYDCQSFRCKTLACGTPSGTQVAAKKILQLVPY
jgi:hypothetical protein